MGRVVRKPQLPQLRNKPTSGLSVFCVQLLCVLGILNFCVSFCRTQNGVQVMMVVVVVGGSGSKVLSCYF